MARKLVLSGVTTGDESLAADLLALMAQEQTDFTLTFRRLADLAQPGSGHGVSSLFEFSPVFDSWLERWRQRIGDDPQSAGTRQASMYRANPVFIPRNHLVAAAIDAAVHDADFTPFNALVDLLEQPRDYEPALLSFARPPRPEEVVSKTFCGT
jgi:uncharacterized protein YdiU (UPF0061 family)